MHQLSPFTVIKHIKSGRLYPMRTRLLHFPYIQSLLCLDRVGSLEHVIDLLEVVGAWKDG